MATQLAGVLLGPICGPPAWKVSAFVGSDVVTSQVFWEGLWMNCVIRSAGHAQCKAYDSVLALPRDLQASRAPVCASLAAGALALAPSAVGARRTSFLRHDWPAKNRSGPSAGAAFVAAGLLCVIPVSLSAHAVVTGFFDPPPSEERRGELGASIYVGWTSGGAARRRRRAGVLRLPLLTARPRRPDATEAPRVRKDQKETGGQEYASGPFGTAVGKCLRPHAVVPACLPACVRADTSCRLADFGTREPKLEIPPPYGCGKLGSTGFRTHHGTLVFK